MKPKILFRASLVEEEELEAARFCNFNVIESRFDINAGDLIIPRYSVLPYYEELENDCKRIKAKLANSYTEHRYIADLQNWYQDLKEYTPKTWFTLDTIDEDAPYVIKGETNSRKNLWRTHMYCPDRAQFFQAYFNLQDDSLIGQQKIYIRKFEKFITYDYNCITDQPITKEFRCFFWKEKCIGYGYYWANQPEVIEKYNPTLDEEGLNFAKKIANIVCNKVPFFVVDIAQKEDGQWCVVELNDGQMSGLSCINPTELYSNLYKALL